MLQVCRGREAVNPCGYMSIIHLLHPLHGVGVLMHCFEEVGEPLACGSGYRLSWKTCSRNFFNEGQQYPVLDPFAEKIRIDECRGSEGGAEDIDVVIVRPCTIAAGI